jgi:hypothetical protein
MTFNIKLEPNMLCKGNQPYQHIHQATPKISSQQWVMRTKNGGDNEPAQNFDKVVLAQ